jgi:hypothetical protein
MSAHWVGYLALGMTCAWGQGYPGGGGGYSGGSGIGYGGNGGLAIARVNAAPSGFGGGQGGFAGGNQALGAGGGFGGSGGGLHGVTRRSFMAEPNTIAAQFFSTGGVPLAIPGAAGTGGYGGYGGVGSFGANRPRLSSGPQLPPRLLNGRPNRGAGHRELAKRGLPHQRTTAGYAASGHAGELVSGEPERPALTAMQMAGVAPADVPPSPVEAASRPASTPARATSAEVQSRHPRSLNPWQALAR